MLIRDIPNNELNEIAVKAGTKVGYLMQIKYGYQKPSSDLARRIEEATEGRIRRWDLLYPGENPDTAPMAKGE